MSRQLVVGAVIVDPQGEILAARRTRPSSLVGCWEFPGGKVEPGEDPRDALVRELTEELGVRIQVHAELESAGAADGRPGLCDGAWPIDEDHELRVWFCSLVGGDPQPGDSHDQITWVSRDQLLDLVWAPADEPIARLLAAR